MMKGGRRGANAPVVTSTLGLFVTQATISHNDGAGGDEIVTIGVGSSIADGGSGGAGSASSDTPLAGADDLSVEVVLLPSASVSLARARATVYDNSGAEPVVIGVYEQSIDLGERTRGSKR